VTRVALNAHTAKTFELKPQRGRSFMRALLDRL
jgi:hypothetical protein